MFTLVPFICSPICLFRVCSNLYTRKQHLSYLVFPKFPRYKNEFIENNYAPLHIMVITSKLHLNQNCQNYLDFNDNFIDEEKSVLSNSMLVFEDFLSPKEEKTMFDEVEPYMKRLRYEFDHWDDAIHGFRETERLKWNAENTKILDRVRTIAFPPDRDQLQHVHVLDLSPDGHIKAHVDSTRFCGNIIAGLSLLSDSVMRLVHNENKMKIVDVLLKQRSLYIMRDTARYDYTHEILANPISKYKDMIVTRSRRISVICRNEPSKNK